MATAVPENGQAELNLKIEAVPRELREETVTNGGGRGGGANWSRQWWKVPFGAVVDALRVRFEGIEAGIPNLGRFDDVGTIAGLRAALVEMDVDVKRDPLEVARGNAAQLDSVVRSVRELHRAWLLSRGHGLEGSGADSAKGVPPRPDLGAAIYLRRWSAGELFHRVMCGIEDGEFREGCTGCDTVEGARKRLDISMEDVERARKTLRKTDQATLDEERVTANTVEIAGEPFEIGGAGACRADLGGSAEGWLYALEVGQPAHATLNVAAGKGRHRPPLDPQGMGSAAHATTDPQPYSRIPPWSTATGWRDGR